MRGGGLLAGGVGGGVRLLDHVESRVYDTDPIHWGAKLTKVKSEEYIFTQQPVRLLSGGGHTERI
jgi:hypothetical protein